MRAQHERAFEIIACPLRLAPDCTSEVGNRRSKFSQFAVTIAAICETLRVVWLLPQCLGQIANAACEMTELDQRRTAIVVGGGAGLSEAEMLVVISQRVLQFTDLFVAIGTKRIGAAEAGIPLNSIR